MEKKEKVSCIFRNYQLIIYVYAAVEAPGAYLPLSLFVDGALCAEYYITTHSYARARVLESRAGPEGGGEGVRASAPCSHYTSLKSCHPLRYADKIYSRFHTSLRGG